MEEDEGGGVDEGGGAEGSDDGVGSARFSNSLG